MVMRKFFKQNFFTEILANIRKKLIYFVKINSKYVIKILNFLHSEIGLLWIA